MTHTKSRFSHDMAHILDYISRFVIDLKSTWAIFL